MTLLREQLERLIDDMVSRGVRYDDAQREFEKRFIAHVLAKADGDLRVRDIHEGVERVLGAPVSRSSVKDYLRKGCRRRVPLFEYRGKSGYRSAGP